MEAVTAIARNYLKNMRVVLILGVVLGLLLGLIIGWGLWPVQWTDATPEVLRSDLQQDYLRMTIDSYNRTGDPNRALERWNNLGPARDQVYGQVASDPGYLNPADVQSFGQLVQSVTGAPVVPSPGTTEEPGTMSQAVIYASVAILIILLGVVGLFAYRLLRKGTGVMTPAKQATEINRHTERMSFDKLGIATPIAHMMATYVAGDDLYDESFGINTEAGEFLGEYGVAIAGELSVGVPKKVSALEIWLFDKEDIQTSTKVVMSEHAFNTPASRERLATKGELILAEPQKQILLETKLLQLLAVVVDMEYGEGGPTNNFFKRITLELAVWQRQNTTS